MVLSYYFYAIPYKIGWMISGLLGKRIPLAFYCSNTHDYYVFEPVRKHLPSCIYIAKNKTIKTFLKQRGIHSKSMPVFPETVVMAFHAAHKFSPKSILKIGMRHGPYHFKSMISSDKYNRFHAFFLTSPHEVDKAEKLGIRCAMYGGYPRLDAAFNGSISSDSLKKLAKKAQFDPKKKTLLFTATWDGSGMSAIDRWIAFLPDLSLRYNIAVTLHHWMSSTYISAVKDTPGVYFIQNEDVLPWEMLADIMIGDTSSILGEFCALDKPIITFRVQSGKRLNPEIIDMLKKISYRINDGEELRPTIERALLQPNYHHKARMEANQKMFGVLDGQHGKRIAQEIMKLMDNHS